MTALRQMIEDGLHDAVTAGALSASVDRIAVANLLMERLYGPQDAPRALSAVPRPHRIPVELERVLVAATELFDVTAADLLGDKKYAALVDARHVAWHVARHTGSRWSYPQIAMAFGGRDHSSVMSGCRRVEQALAGRMRDQQRAARLRGQVAALVAAVGEEERRQAS